MAISVRCKSCNSRVRVKNEDRGKTVPCTGCGKDVLMDAAPIRDFDVFVSYSSKDKQVCDLVLAALEAAHMRCWVAPRNIAAGTNWGASIINGISNSRVMVLIFTKSSNASPQVLREVERAINKGLAIIPLRLDTTDLSPNMEYFISASQWLDAMTPPLEVHLDGLIKAVYALMDGADAAEPSHDDDLQSAPEMAMPTAAEEDQAPQSQAPQDHAPVAVDPARRVEAAAPEQETIDSREMIESIAAAPSAEPPAVSVSASFPAVAPALSVRQDEPLAAVSERATFAVLPPEQRLLNHASRFDFFQAVLILERAALLAQPSHDGISGHVPVPIGHDGPPDREAVRFHAMPTLGFPNAPVVSVARPKGKSGAGDDPAADGSPARMDMQVTFMGLAGASGALPDHYTSLLIERIKYKDVGLRDFLDLFNHRLLSLFFRAWEKYRFESAYERYKHQGAEPQVTNSDVTNPWARADDFSSILLSLVGLGTGGLQGRSAVEDEAILYFAGHFARHVRCATSLEDILNDYFAMPCEVRQFVGQWLPLAAEDRSQMRRRMNGQSSYCTLGVDAVLGERVWDVQSKFRVRAGPLTYAQYVQLLPGGVGLKKMFELVRFYVGVEFDFDVQPLLKASEVPSCRIGGDANDPAAAPSRLGRNFWTLSRPASQDFDGAVFASPLA